MLDLMVIDDAAVAVAMLDPFRRQVLTALCEPGSASSLASDLGLPRQRVNYHLRTLEDHGLVSLLEERPRRGLTERIVQASARSYVISPEVLGTIAADPDRTDHLSARYILATASRTVREVATMLRQAEGARKTLPTLTIDTNVRFASAADRKAFTEELAGAIGTVVARYHDDQAPNGRWHRLLVSSHPKPKAIQNPESAT